MTYDKKDFSKEALLHSPIIVVDLEHTKEKKTMTHAEAVKMVRGKRNADRRKIGNNTYAEILHDGTVAIKLHNTYVVKINPNGTYTLNSGGWQTVTTKDRINQYSPRYVFQKNYEWFVKINDKIYPFMDGMVVS
jgi:hypothetical protein